MKMIAAVVVLALVASTQAFPGSVNSQQFEVESLFLKENSITCVIGEIGEVIKCGGQALDLGKQAIVDVQQLVQSIKSCASADDQLVCSCQAVRDSWESSEKLRSDIVEVATEAANAIKEIQSKCLSKPKNLLY